MTPDNVFGFARNTDVHKAIMARLEFIQGDDVVEISKMLGEAVAALLEINETIPVQSRHRHLVAQPLEAFADGETT